MRRVLVAAALLLPGACAFAATCGAPHGTTAGSIALVNLDGQVQRLPRDASRVDLLLERARFLSDDAALEEAVALSESDAPTAAGLLRRARAHAAVHAFAIALEDLAAASAAGADATSVLRQRASIGVATGRTDDALPLIEAQARAQPGYASEAALAVAYGEAGRFDEADAHYARAWAMLDTTSPFPYAWLAFARGVLWSEQAGDRKRGEAFYAQAIACLPEFVAANVHMAEIEVARGALDPAQARLERVLARADEPEAMALLGVIHRRRGDAAQANRWIAAARTRFDTLLARQPLAYADHAAAFYLGPGEDSERAWQLARQNLANRRTRRSLALAEKAARAVQQARTHASR